MKIAIIGAGLAGLTAAYELRDHEVTVLEADGRIGGKLHTVPFKGGPTDMGAEAFVRRRQDAVEFFRELGLEDALVDPSDKRPRVYTGGKLHFMPPGGLMGIPAEPQDFFSAATNERIANEVPFEWTPGHDVSVGALVRQQYGDEVVDHLLSALLGGVYSCVADDLGLRATLPMLARKLDELAADGPVTLSAAVAAIESGRSPAASHAFATFKDGFKDLYETLAEKSGAEIHLDTFVSGVTRTKDGFQVTGAEGTFDRVVFATPAPTTARLISKVSPEAAQTLKDIKLASSVVVGFNFASAIDPAGNSLPDATGILVAADEPGIQAKAFTLSSRKWPHLGQREGFLVRASFGRFGDDALVRAEEDDLVDIALDDLKTITGFDGRAAGVEEIYTQRWFGGLPRYDHTHLETVAAVEESLAGVEGVAATGAWAHGVGIPDVIAHARKVARDLA
ncbi:protoporphyrinogen oxidase [Corynebacterium phocae]|uniref:Coproporphyrinogen III oxidase n=1 Tax=Corynebacterium phocae TaxID=161895 RepID=A0A1L7D148_9CORY|nr:protoporphyrinogen oxidase [Corynebacterium phocae]APT91828.1 protoporphyrinogen oxidase [Corynebacterium phocae]KAA8727946.1 protoporphyrinogen oxidase [Corynebacterium phocae]